MLRIDIPVKARASSRWQLRMTCLHGHGPRMLLLRFMGRACCCSASWCIESVAAAQLVHRVVGCCTWAAHAAAPLRAQEQLQGNAWKASTCSTAPGLCHHAFVLNSACLLAIPPLLHLRSWPRDERHSSLLSVLPGRARKGWRTRLRPCSGSGWSPAPRARISAGARRECMRHAARPAWRAPPPAADKIAWTGAGRVLDWTRGKLTTRIESDSD